MHIPTLDIKILRIEERVSLRNVVLPLSIRFGRLLMLLYVCFRLKLVLRQIV